MAMTPKAHYAHPGVLKLQLRINALPPLAKAKVQAYFDVLEQMEKVALAGLARAEWDVEKAQIDALKAAGVQQIADVPEGEATA